MRLLALRGATTADANTAEAIGDATAELVGAMLADNGVAAGDIVSIIFTATTDLDAAFPAAAARDLGLTNVPLMCATEMAVVGSVRRCIRVLMHLYSERDYASLRPVYLRGAAGLRDDLS